MARPRRNEQVSRPVTVHLDPDVLAEIRSTHPGKSLGAAFEAVWRSGGSREPESAQPHDFQRSGSGLVRICSKCDCSANSKVGQLPICPVIDPKGTK